MKVEPSKEDKVENDNKTTCGQHKPSEDYVLRVVASSVGDGGVRKRVFLLGRYCHVVGEETGKDKKRDKEVHGVGEMQASKKRVSSLTFLVLFLCRWYF